MEWLKGRQELDCCLAVCYVELIRQKSVPLVGCPTFPLIDQGGAGVIKEKTRGREGPSKVLGLLFP